MENDLSLYKNIIDRVNVGVVVVDKDFIVSVWNQFMQTHSHCTEEEVLGKNLFSCFPDLPKEWLEKKIQSVFLLKNFSFTSWEQRPYLFQFDNTCSLTSNIEHMQQDCTFVPLKNEQGEVEFVCISLVDVTDTSMYQTMLKAAMESLKEISIRDALTGIYNRGHLEDVLATEFRRAKRYHTPLSLIIFDLDDFKLVNDTYGHMAGDEVIRNTAKQIESLLRTSDTAGRYGGEEFLIILPNINRAGAHGLAERMRKQLASSRVPFNNEEIGITISMGISELTHHPRYEDLVKEADLALYASKAAGKNRATCFNSAI